MHDKSARGSWRRERSPADSVTASVPSPRGFLSQAPAHGFRYTKSAIEAAFQVRPRCTASSLQAVPARDRAGARTRPALATCCVTLSHTMRTFWSSARADAPGGAFLVHRPGASGLGLHRADPQGRAVAAGCGDGRCGSQDSRYPSGGDVGSLSIGPGQEGPTPAVRSDTLDGLGHSLTRTSCCAAQACRRGRWSR
jgi:hypothetical protein